MGTRGSFVQAATTRIPGSPRACALGLILPAALACTGAGALEVSAEKGQTPERMQRDLAECRELARSAAAESDGRLRISAPIPVGGEPGGAVPETPAEGAPKDGPGLFGGLRQPGAAPEPPPPDRAEAARTAESETIERAYAACLRARGYSVQTTPEGD